MGLFIVQVKTYAAIVAESMEDAEAKASCFTMDICRDADMEIEPEIEIDSEIELTQYGWDTLCVPYGHDGNTTIGEYLKDRND